MNRRQMIKQSGLTIGAVAIGGPLVLTQVACDKKDLSFYVSTVVGALKDLSPLLPGLGDKIATAIKVAEEFDKAYKDGKFENATVLFNNLAGVISQIIAAAGIDNQQVKLALAVTSIAIRAIASLLKSQAPAGLTASHAPQLATIERLANAGAIDAAYKASKL